MGFKVAARTIFHLGAELIGSDEIAFYELIKNAIDAKSKRVDVDVVIRISYSDYIKLKNELNDIENKSPRRTVQSYKKNITKKIKGSFKRDDLIEKIENCKTYDDLRKRLKFANYISFKDKGEGMSKDDLENIYLTIGTDNRKNNPDALGDKGIGRLSAMRLGNILHVRSTKSDEYNWNKLDINWDDFQKESSILIENIPVTLTKGKQKKSKNIQGTRIYIYDLNAYWDYEKTANLVRKELSKLTDPFPPNESKDTKSIYPINIRYNDDPVNIEELFQDIFKIAHAEVFAEFDPKINDESEIRGFVKYLYRKKEKTIEIKAEKLLSKAGNIPEYIVSEKDFYNMGGFKLHFYWYNRQLLMHQHGRNIYRDNYKNILDNWTGGIMVYRDGYRVFPYGNPDDDWLDLDKKAFSTGGYKVNRTQILGKVDISKSSNKYLIDQSNREGIKDCKEKDIFKLLLKSIMQDEFKNFIGKIDREIQAREPATIENISEKASSEKRKLVSALNSLKINFPDIKEDKEFVPLLEKSTEQIGKLLDEVSVIIKEYSKGHHELVHLAGLGKMLEIIAHELYRSTKNALDALETGEFKYNSANFASQLKSIHKQIAIFSDLRTRSIEHPEKFDLITIIKDVVNTFGDKLGNKGINFKLNIHPENIKSAKIEMIKGMIIQILENLFDNSIYWLRQRKIYKKNFKPRIIIDIFKNEEKIYFYDNGPGIDYDEKEEIFEPFFSHKPVGKKSHGLGLYICKELTKINDIAINLTEEPVHENNSKDKLNTFLIDLGGNSVGKSR